MAQPNSTTTPNGTPVTRVAPPALFDHLVRKELDIRRWQDLVTAAGEAVFESLGGYDVRDKMPDFWALVARDGAATGNKPFLDPEAEVTGLMIDTVETCVLIGYGLGRTAPDDLPGLDTWAAKAMKLVGLHAKKAGQD